MAENKYLMDLKKIRKLYRHKFIVLCQSGDTQTPEMYLKYQIIDVINHPMEKSLIFLLNDKKTVKKILINLEILKTGKGEIQHGKITYQIRIVNARNFPIADSSHFSIS